MSIIRQREGLAARLFPAGLAAALVGFGLYFDHAATLAQERQLAALDDALAGDAASPEVRRVVRWAVATQDAAGLPFVVVDSASRVYSFDPQGRPTGATGAVPARPGVAYVIERGHVARRPT